MAVLQRRVEAALRLRIWWHNSIPIIVTASEITVCRISTHNKPENFWPMPN